MGRPRDNEPHALYRLWSKSGELLYAGCSFTPFSRMKDHETQKLWYGDVASATIEWHPNRAAAMDAEKSAILGEKPTWNIHYQTGVRVHTWGKLHRAVNRSNPDTWVRKTCGAA